MINTRDRITLVWTIILATAAFVGAFLFVSGCSTPLGGRANRACILAENALKQSHKEGSCESVSLGETTDYAILSFDGGKRWCHDTQGLGGRDGGPLACAVLQPTNEEIAANAAADAKAKIEADAKVKAEAEAKARANVKAGSGTPKPKEP